MMPPLKLEPLFDRHGGFTAETKPGNTLWRPGHVAKSTDATLVTYDEYSFFQLNNNVTKATYKLRRYQYPVIAWFDNLTFERIA